MNELGAKNITKISQKFPISFSLLSQPRPLVVLSFSFFEPLFCKNERQPGKIQYWGWGFQIFLL
jgi:hypothetical protein